jgi:hypothetical protein
MRFVWRALIEAFVVLGKDGHPGTGPIIIHKPLVRITRRHDALTQRPVIQGSPSPPRKVSHAVEGRGDSCNG